MARPQSTRTLLIGMAVLIVGAGLVFVVMNGSGSKKTTNPAANTNSATPTTRPAPVVTQSTPASVVIPNGMQAVAIQAPFTQGLAGYARPGDQVDVYATVEKGPARPGVGPPFAKLLQQHVAVLAISAPPSEAGTGNATYLLALLPDAAEQVIFFAKFESVWLTLVPKDQKPVVTTGHGYLTAS
jgi:Flp pilus assembly protein CpaB